MKSLLKVVSCVLLFSSAILLISCGHEFWATSSSTNPTGATSTFVFTANNGAGNLSEFTVGSTGALTAVSSSPVTVASGIVSVAANSAGTLVFAVTANGGLYSYTVNRT